MGIVPQFQGRGLSRPLLSAVMARMAQEHAAAFLETQTTSYKAIGLYLTFGFIRYPRGDQDRHAWDMVEVLLDRDER